MASAFCGRIGSSLIRCFAYLFSSLPISIRNHLTINNSNKPAGGYNALSQIEENDPFFDPDEENADLGDDDDDDKWIQNAAKKASSSTTTTGPTNKNNKQ
jgi:hypothetical protein